MESTQIQSAPAIQRKQLLRLIVAASTLLVAMMVALSTMGRRWWCACGSWSPASWDIWSSHNSQHLVDPYFFSHFLHGIVFYGFLYVVAKQTSSSLRIMIALAIEVGWELLENSPLIINRYREATISLDYFGDSIANSLFDVIGCMLGYFATAGLRWWAVPLFLLIELLMVATIRDCLTLNVLMLVWPIEAIKQWQTPL